MSSSIFPIILNSSHVDPNDLSTYTYKFPRGSAIFKNASVAISQINIFYSWRNIDKSAYNNNQFKLIFPNATSLIQEYDVIIPDGNYDVAALNSFLQHWSIQNGCYLRNDVTQQNRYYIELVTHPETYKIQLISYEIPTSIPPGYSNPGNMTFPIQAGLTPVMKILSTNNFGQLLGFNPGEYGSHMSDVVPQMSPVSSVLVGCSLVHNKFTNPDNILLSFVSGKNEYGSMIQVQNQDIQYSKIEDGTYTQLQIKFYTNEFKRLNILDPNLIVYLIIKIDN